MENKYIVLVGLGSIGERHLKNIRLLYPSSTITVVRRSGGTVSSVEGLADNVVGSIEEAFVLGLPDAGIIASPAPFHVSDAKLFLDKQCPVFIEKPLSNDIEGVLSLIELSRKNNVKCMVGYILRFLITLKKIDSIIKNEEYGKVINAIVSAGQFLPDWRPTQDYRHSVSANKKLGGGALLELSHEIDYLLSLFGRPVKVSAFVQNSGRLDIDVEDQVDGMLQYSDGKVIHLHLDFLQKVPSRSCSISMERANLLWNINAGTLSIDNGQEDIKEDRVTVINNDLYLEELRHFFQSIQENKDPCVSLTDGLNVLQLVALLRRSSLTNSVVGLPLN